MWLSNLIWSTTKSAKFVRDDQARPSHFIKIHRTPWVAFDCCFFLPNNCLILTILRTIVGWKKSKWRFFVFCCFSFSFTVQFRYRLLHWRFGFGFDFSLRYHNDRGDMHIDNIIKSNKKKMKPVSLCVCERSGARVYLCILELSDKK